METLSKPLETEKAGKESSWGRGIWGFPDDFIHSFFSLGLLSIPVVPVGSRQSEGQQLSILVKIFGVKDRVWGSGAQCITHNIRMKEGKSHIWGEGIYNSAVI